MFEYEFLENKDYESFKEDIKREARQGWKVVHIFIRNDQPITYTCILEKEDKPRLRPPRIIRRPFK